jgi:hypothetical protein
MKRVLHFHIPKTGGTAIQHHFVEQLGKERVSDTIVGQRLRDALVQFGYFDVIGGHFLLQQGDRLPQDRCCITVLRHPFDRFLSEYFYHKIDCADRPLDSRLHGLSLETYLDQLSLDEQEGLAAQIGMLYPLGTSAQTVISLEEKFNAAIKAIDCFELIGVQDELEDFACMLDARLGLKYIPLKLKNVTSQRISAGALPPQQIQKLTALFPYELEFYQYAKSRFQASRRECLKRSTLVSHADEPESLEPSFDSVDVSPQSEGPIEFGDRRCTIENASVFGKISGGSLAMIGEYFSICLRIKANESIDSLNVGIAIRDERGLLMFGTSSMQLGRVYALRPGEYLMRFDVLNRMPRGNYRIDASLTKDESRYLGCYHWREDVTSFIVHDNFVSYFEGYILMDADVFLASATDEAVFECRPYEAASNQARSLGRVNKPLTQFNSVVTLAGSMGNLFPDTEICVPVRVENTSQESWVASGRQPVALAYRWLASTREVVVADGIRTRLPADVPPGGAIVVPMRISIPGEHQSLQLVISLVQEAVAWFVDRDPDSAYIQSVELGLVNDRTGAVAGAA